MHSFTLSFLAFLITFTGAQVPPYQGKLLVEPGNDAGKCLTAQSDANGASVVLETCTNAAGQQWTFSGGAVRVFDDKCLDVTDGRFAAGTKLQVQTCTPNNANQQWFYTGSNRLQGTNHRNFCVDLTDGRLSDDNPIQIWSCSDGNANQVWNVGYSASALPDKSENGQTGTNNCGTSSSQSSMCQTLWINSLDDFCLYAPPSLGAIGDTEREEVSWCTKSGHGTRVIPGGTFKGAHFVQTPEYVQITGVGNFTSINIRGGDAGGELDPHGADGNGNPIGGLVFGNTFGNNKQYHEWTEFISDNEFCIRACVGPRAAQLCQHIYDVMGCFWNMPANYDSGVFESCDGDPDLPMGVYGTSTWHQGVSPTPPPHPAAPSSNCQTIPTIVPSASKREIEAPAKRYPLPPVAS